MTKRSPSFSTSIKAFILAMSIVVVFLALSTVVAQRNEEMANPPVVEASR